MPPKTLARILTFALCAIFLIRPAATEDVHIPDANLRAAINETLNKKPEAAALTESEMQSLTKLNIETYEISDLIGLEHATNLTQLHLDYQKRRTKRKIVDVSPLENLKSLEALDLAFNAISDVSPLENLKHLKKLILNNNSVSDISSLIGLAHLKGLSCWENPLNADSLNIYVPQLRANGTSVLLWDPTLRD